MHKNTSPVPKGQSPSRILTLLAWVLGMFVGLVLIVYVPPQEFMVIYQITVLLFAIAMILGLYALRHARNNLAKQTIQNQTLIAQLSRHYENAIENARIQANSDALYQRTIEQLLAVLDAIEEGLILINQEGAIALANPRMTMLDVSPLGLITNSVIKLLEKEDSQIYKPLGFSNQWELRALIARLKTPTEWDDYPQHAYNLMVKGQMRHFSRQILPVRDELGRVIGILLAFYDKTQEHELHHAREQLTRMIVHDLRSPLTAVMTSFKIITELMPPDAPRKAKIVDILDISKRAMHKLLGRVDTLLDIAKLEDGKFGLITEATMLSNIIENVQKELTPMAQEANVNLLIETDPTLPLVQIDADKIERLLLNLVDNALKYSPENGTIRIKAYMNTPQEVKLNGTVTPLIRLEVSDEGAGIPTEARATLFESFTQVEGRKAVRRGVGLGLAFCKLVAVAHGGDIWMEDNIPQGSRFIVTLPTVQVTVDDDIEVPTNIANIVSNHKVQ
ncbi:MAG: ATP-binding protein [Anaerolineae bacterium]|nr:ATP-binding protein [Anaerolineae bacterium]